MPHTALPEQLKDLPVHMIGIKGTGMAALAEILHRRGARITGSDVPEEFYTDAVLRELGLPVREGFRPENIPADAALVVRSAAYDEDHPEVAAALARHLPVLTYTQALGELSGHSVSWGIAGVHGKTTTTALAGTLLRALDLPATVLVGSAVSGFGNRSTWTGGDRYLVAETCEYRRHFLDFHPAGILLTGVEPDHLDYFRDYDDIIDAFVTYLSRLPEGGAVLWCAENAGAAEAVDRVRRTRPDIRAVPYGAGAGGAWETTYLDPVPGENRFRLAAWDRIFRLRVPGRHVAQDAAGALALAVTLLEAEGREVNEDVLDRFQKALSGFAGSRRRAEIVGEAGGILFMDDYGHHPTAIAATLEGLRTFHPDRRLVVDFMSHTYSRTAALLEEFAGCFSAADQVILHDIYASAREQYNGSVTGRDLYDRTAAVHPAVRWFPAVDDAASWLRGELRPGDLFLTMGAGNNWTLGRDLYHHFKEAAS